MRFGKIVLSAMAVVLLLLQYRLWLSPDGMQEVWRIQDTVKERETAIQERTIRNKNLEAEVFDLKEGVKAAEERARGDLGMVGADETFYRVVDEKQ